MPKIATPRSDTGAKIRLARTRLGMTQSDLARITGLSQRVISQYELGNVEPPLKSLKKIASALGVPVSYFTNESHEATTTHTSCRIPYFGKIPAGNWSDQSPNEFFTYFELDDIAKTSDYCLQVEGDSMLPSIRPGDIVFIKSCVDLSDGTVVVVRNDNNELTLKRVIHRGSMHLLKPDNPKYEPLPAVDAVILGVVVGLFRKRI